MPISGISSCSKRVTVIFCEKGHYNSKLSLTWCTITTGPYYSKKFKWRICFAGAINCYIEQTWGFIESLLYSIRLCGQTGTSNKQNLVIKWTSNKKYPSNKNGRLHKNVLLTSVRFGKLVINLMTSKMW